MLRAPGAGCANAPPTGRDCIHGRLAMGVPTRGVMLARGSARCPAILSPTDVTGRPIVVDTIAADGPALKRTCAPAMVVCPRLWIGAVWPHTALTARDGK